MAMKGGRKSRDKGNRAERAIVKFLQERGFAAERVPFSGGPWAWNDLPQIEPSAATLSWVKSRQIAFAKARAA
jgi:Holliday junction resolvase